MPKGALLPEYQTERTSLDGQESSLENARSDFDGIADESSMKIAQISNAGLWAMGVLVAVLWGFIVLDRLIRHRANLEVAQTMQELKSLQTRNHRNLPLRARSQR
jgi:hypothetical protein